VKKVGVIILALAALLGCEPTHTSGKKQSNGKAKHVTVRIANGTKLGKSNYGTWRATSEDVSCRWVILRGHRVLKSGGLYDAVVSGRSTKGATLNANHCGYFYR
jgi:hypothetical protein